MPRYRFGPHAIDAAIDLDLPRDAGGRALVQLRRVAAHEPQPWIVERDDRAGLGSIRSWHAPDGGGYRLRFCYADHAADFVIDGSGRDIALAVTGGVPREHLAWLFQGPVLGRALRLAGRPCLHATVLSDGTRSIALSGPSGAGKSTLAAALVKAGATLLGDDLAVIEEGDEGLVVHPGAASLRLWPDSAAHAPVAEHAPVLAGVDTLAKVTVTLPAGADRAAQPLAAFYRLAPRVDDTAAVRPLPPAAASAAIAGNIYGGLPPSVPRARREFAWAARLAGRMKVGELSVPNGHALLAEQAPSLLARLLP